MKSSQFVLGAITFAAGFAVASTTFAQAFGNQQANGFGGNAGAQGVSSSSGAFGARTLGGGLGGGQGGPGSAFGGGQAGGMQNSAQVGQAGGAAGFQAQSFVGAAQQMNSALFGGAAAQGVQGMNGMQGMQGMQGGRGGQQGLQGLQGMNGQLGQQRNQQRQNQNQNQQRQQQGGNATANARAVRTSFAIDFAHPTVSTSKVATKLSLELTKSRAITALGPVTVEMQGRTAILRGVVATDHDRSLAERLALLEPGVAQIQNELQVQSARPLTPEEQQAASARLQ